MSTYRCKTCGNELADYMTFCTQCGTPVVPDTPVTQMLPMQQTPHIQKKNSSRNVLITVIVVLFVLIAVEVGLFIHYKITGETLQDMPIETDDEEAEEDEENDNKNASHNNSKDANTTAPSEAKNKLVPISTNEFYVELKKGIPELNNWVLVNESGTSKFYTKTGSVEKPGGALLITDTMLEFVEKDTYFVGYQLGWGEKDARIVIKTENFYSFDENTVVLIAQIFLKNTGHQSDIQSILNNANYRSTVTNGAKIYKEVIDDVNYEVYRATNNSYLTIIISF